jgi:hypothetical protein
MAFWADVNNLLNYPDMKMMIRTCSLVAWKTGPWLNSMDAGRLDLANRLDRAWRIGGPAAS